MKALLACCTACALLLIASRADAAEFSPIRTPYAKQGPLAIRHVAIPTAPVRQFDCIEIVVDLTATYDNPFDSADIALDARVTLPDGRTWTMPGFLYRPFERKLENGAESLTPSGETSWRVRFAPPTAGNYSVVIAARDRTGQKLSEPTNFSVQAGDDPGYVHVSRRDRRYFEFDNGRAYYPIGLNICWGGSRKTFDYDEWFPAFGRTGCTSTRLWLSAGWPTFALERPGKAADGLGMGQLDMAGAWRLDYVLNLARRHGLYVKLCIDSFNTLRSKTCYNYWEQAPHNVVNGGPLHEPKEFWTDSTMDRFYRNKLRYLVARYGCFTHVLAWEFWNEVDLVDAYQSEPVRDWHRRMADYLRSIDPYGHLITTSFARSDGDPAVNGLAELNYVQTHLYGGGDPIRQLAAYQVKKEAFGKPHYTGEFGADAGSDSFAADPDGLQIHDSLWISTACGGSGTAQPWYWQQVQNYRMHSHFATIARFTSGIDWPAEQMRRVQPQCSWSKTPTPLPRKDIILETTVPTWEPSPTTRPRTVQIDKTGVHGQVPIAGIQHTLRSHKDQYNPVRLEIDLPWATQFGCTVCGVSGYGGAKLVLRLDGRAVVEKDFANTNPAGKTETLRQYDGWYGVDVPPGKHTVELENVGNDWFLCDYQLRNGMECREPPLLAWATVGRTTALSWIRLEARSWTQVCVTKATAPACAPSVLSLPGLAAGRWKAEIWDTWAGRIVQEHSIDVGADGNAHVPLPEIVKDLAVRLKRIDQQGTAK